MLIQQTIDAIIDSTITSNLNDPDHAADNTWSMWHDIGIELYNRFMRHIVNTLLDPGYQVILSPAPPPSNGINLVRNQIHSMGSAGQCVNLTCLHQFIELIHQYYVQVITTFSGFQIGTSVSSPVPVVITILPTYHVRIKNLMQTAVDNIVNIPVSSLQSTNDVIQLNKRIASVFYDSNIHILNASDVQYLISGNPVPFPGGTAYM